MNKKHIEFLVCPETKRPLELESIKAETNGKLMEGTLREPISGKIYPVVNYIPRFVPADNYATNFGFQWLEHMETQQDSYSGVELSKKRFVEETKWAKDLSGELILEAGSGSGRFTTHALATGATIVSFDYSNAVEANYKVNGDHSDLLLVQADIYNMPFPDDFFDKAFCFGVLQHTPKPKESFMSIIEHIKPGGSIATDVYWKALRRFLHMKTWLRIFTKNRNPESLYPLVKRYVDIFWPMARALRGTYYGQKFVSRIVADRSEQLPHVEDAMLKEWAYLDTFDWLSPTYDNPQTLEVFLQWHQQAGLEQIEVHRGYNGLEGRGVKRRTLAQ